jgi:glycosyltransferase involved in cell wall biosynthesis
MNASLRILVLHSRYLSGDASGENRVVEDEVRVLREGGHQVTVWDPEPDELHGLGLVRTGMRTVWSPGAASRVRGLVRKHRPDVVHLHNLFPMLSPSAVRAAGHRKSVASTMEPGRLRGGETGAGPPGPAIVMTLHNYRLLCLPGLLLRDDRICEDCVGRLPWRGIVHRCYRGSALGSSAIAGSLVVHRAAQTFAKVNRYLAISGFVKDKHVEAGFAPSSIRIKPHFAWPSQRRRGPGEHFLYLGRLSPEKGVATAIAAWHEGLPRLVVAGDGPQGPKLRAVAGGNVEFVGAVPPAKVPVLLSRARAVVAPSTCYEGAGKSVLEAYAAGVPVIASRIGGLTEAVEDGVTGFLVPPGDRTALTEAALRMSDDASCERMGHAAWRRWRDRHSPELGLRNLEAAYADAMAVSADGPDRLGEEPWPRPADA